MKESKKTETSPIYTGQDYAYSFQDWHESDSLAYLSYGVRSEWMPHDKLLTEALYSKWSNADEQGFQYLADAYNVHVRKENEPAVLPPPTFG